MGNEQTQSNSALPGALSGRREQGPRGFLRSRSVCILTKANWKGVVPASSQGGANPRDPQPLHSRAELWALCCPCQSRLAQGNSAGSFLVLHSSSLTNPVLNKMSFQISTTTAINLQNKPEWPSPKSRAVKSFNFCPDRRALFIGISPNKPLWWIHGGSAVSQPL